MGNFFNFKGQKPGRRPAGRRRLEVVSIDPDADNNPAADNNPVAGPSPDADNNPTSSTGSTVQPGVVLRLSSTEVKLLQHFGESLSDDFADLANPRLYPEAHLDNQELQKEFADLTRQDLKTSHRKALDNLLATISDNPGDPITYDQLGNWIAALSVLRLALGAKLEAKGISLDNLDEVLRNFPDQDDRFQLAAYLLMADILEEASQFLLNGLASELDEGH